MEKTGCLPSLSITPATTSEPSSTTDPNFIPEWTPVADQPHSKSDGASSVSLNPVPAGLSPASARVDHSHDTDGHLDLLCSDDDDDELFGLSTSPHPHPVTPSHPHSASSAVSECGGEGEVCLGDSQDDKLSRLRVELTGEVDRNQDANMDEQNHGNGAGGGSETEQSGGAPQNPRDDSDGAFLSKREREEVEAFEMEECVTFRGLPPVNCSVAVGDEGQLERLRESADCVCVEVVRLIRSSLSRCR